MLLGAYEGWFGWYAAALVAMRKRFLENSTGGLPCIVGRSRYVLYVVCIKRTRPARLDSSKLD